MEKILEEIVKMDKEDFAKFAKEFLYNRLNQGKITMQEYLKLLREVRDETKSTKE